MSSLEEELKRLKSSTVYKHNNDLLYGHAIKTELDSETKNIRQELSVNSISKTYDKRKVVNRVSLQLNKGEAVGLLGPNGAGKTTCFYIIAGLIDADEGEILLNQAHINHLPMHMRARKGIGYLPQESSIFKGLTVEQNILSVLEIQNYSTNQ